MAGSSMRATDCTTASESFPSAPNGELTYIGEEWTRGNYPRSFNFDPTGQFLYCCNQRGDNIAVFRVDRKTGGLNFTGQYTPVGNPSMHRLPRSCEVELIRDAVGLNHSASRGLWLTAKAIANSFSFAFRWFVFRPEVEHAALLGDGVNLFDNCLMLRRRRVCLSSPLDRRT